MKFICRLVKLLLSIVFLSVVLSGCESNGSKSLRICVDFGPYGNGNSALAENFIFNSRDYGISDEVEIEIVPADETERKGVLTKLRTEIAAGAGPDVFIIDTYVQREDLLFRFPIQAMEQETFDNYNDAYLYIKESKFPIVIKADGLALGKGVLICGSLEDAEKGLKQIMVDKKFGESGDKVVIEEFLTGPEVSVLSFCDGTTVVPMVSAQDHKRAFDGDRGLNTGGMGTFSPSRIYTKEISDICMEKIFKPTVSALKKEGREFKGIIYFGLMITKDGPKVIEYNARFGDPETQVILPRLDFDLFDIFEACVDGKLDKLDIKWKDNAAACVILASGGYPESYEKGFTINGLDKCAKMDNIYIYHAGTAFKDCKFVTNGGRVLGVTGVGKNLDEAIKMAYKGVEFINFKNAHFRRDIGIKKV